jgi:hypothetical protein
MINSLLTAETAMSLKLFRTADDNQLGSMVRDEARMVLGNLIFWMGAMLLFSCPVWLPALIDRFLSR